MVIKNTFKNIGSDNSQGNASALNASLNDMNTETPSYGGESFGDFMSIGEDLNNIVSVHSNAMQKLMADKYDIITLTDGVEYPIITYAKKAGNTVYYYATIITDDVKRPLQLTSFVNSLDQKNADTYTLDVMYDDILDVEIRSKLTSKYPSTNKFVLIASSVVRYAEDTYPGIYVLISKALEVADILAVGKDQTLKNVPKNFNVTYTEIQTGVKKSSTGFHIRADFKLTLSIGANTSASKNSRNKDINSVYGYIDLVPEEEIKSYPGQQPIITKKLRPVIILTEAIALSATPAYGMFNILTAAIMLNRSMYMGHILKKANGLNDLITATLGENVDISKMGTLDKSMLLDSLIMQPIMAIDIPHNGYFEELSFLLENVNTANNVSRSVITKFTGNEFSSNLVDYVIALPYIEYFDKTVKDARAIDCPAIATMTKDVSKVVNYARITNVNGQDQSQTISDLATLLVESGVEGEIIGTYGRVFLCEDGINELFNSAAINCSFMDLWEQPNQADTFIRRAGYSQNTYFNNNNQGGYGSRGYRAF